MWRGPALSEVEWGPRPRQAPEWQDFKAAQTEAEWSLAAVKPRRGGRY